MKKKIVYLIIIVTLINLTALATMIYQRWLDFNENTRVATRESRFEQVKSELALTSSQISHFEKIRNEFHSRVDSLDKNMEGIRHQLLRKIWLPQSEDIPIDSLLNRTSQLQMESQKLVIWHFYQFKKILTPEQWQKFYGIVSKRFPYQKGVSGSKRSAQTEEDNQ